jgi:hypothetical protein
LSTIEFAVITLKFNYEKLSIFKEVLPCENSMPSGPKRSRQFQVPINANPHAHFADPHNPPQYEAEDPWADDRREALKQLSADYVEPQKAEKSQGLH